MTVFGLNSGNDSVEDLENFAAAFQPTFPILLGASSTYVQYRQNGATSPYPLDYVIDQQGRVAYFATEYQPEDMVAVIDQLLDSASSAEEVPPLSAPDLAAYPNPFNPRTTLRFQLRQPGPVRLTIHDTRGRLVRTLVAGDHLNPGTIALPWDGTSDRGAALAAGAYLVRLVTDQGERTRKITLVK